MYYLAMIQPNWNIRTVRTWGCVEVSTIAARYSCVVCMYLQDTKMSDFMPRLRRKASELFPSLSHEDFMSFFLNSRAISAHDAVMMLVSSAHPYLMKNVSLPSSQDPFNPYPLDPCLLVSDF